MPRHALLCELPVIRLTEDELKLASKFRRKNLTKLLETNLAIIALCSRK